MRPIAYTTSCMAMGTYPSMAGQQKAEPEPATRALQSRRSRDAVSSLYTSSAPINGCAGTEDAGRRGLRAYRFQCSDPIPASSCRWRAGTRGGRVSCSRTLAEGRVDAFPEVIAFRKGTVCDAAGSNSSSSSGFGRDAFVSQWWSNWCWLLAVIGLTIAAAPEKKKWVIGCRCCVLWGWSSATTAGCRQWKYRRSSAIGSGERKRRPSYI